MEKPRKFHGRFVGIENEDHSFSIDFQVTYGKVTHVRQWKDITCEPFSWNLEEWLALLVARITAAITTSVK